MSTTKNFYAALPGFQSFTGFADEANYRPLPGDWSVVIADLVDSTSAIERGMHRQVNALSTASVIAVLNVFDRAPLPFVFGGDGAGICVPGGRRDALAQALAASRKLALDAYGLHMRVGVIPASDLYTQNCPVLVAKFQPDISFQQAMFRGGGLSRAEELVKQDSPDNPYIVPTDTPAQASFEGFECRWNEIPSPKEEVVTLLISCLHSAPSRVSRTYADICYQIQEIYGEDSDMHPVRSSELKLTLSPGKLASEARIRTFPHDSGKNRHSYQMRLWWLAMVGKLLMGLGIKIENTDWGRYKDHFVRNTDFRKFDDTLRMVISGSAEQRTLLESYLAELRQERSIAYGLHISQASIVTCMVSDYDRNHMHFVDGAGGGYAYAARALKAQLTDEHLPKF